MGAVPSRASLHLAWGVRCPMGASACCLLPGCTVKLLGGFPRLGGVGLNHCMGASTAKSSLISGLLALFLGIMLTRGEMTSSDDSVN